MKGQSRKGLNNPEKQNFYEKDDVIISDNIDKQIKINMLLEVSNALRSVDSLAQKLDLLKQGTLSGAIFGGVEAAATKAGKNVDETKEKVKSLTQEVNAAIKAAEQQFQATGNVGKDLQKNFQVAIENLLEFKKQLGNLSANSEKSIVANLRRGIDPNNDIYGMLTERLKNLNAEQKKLTDEFKAPKTQVVTNPKPSTSADIPWSSLPRENEMSKMRSEITAIENQRAEALAKTNGIETEHTKQLLEQLNILRQQVSVIKNGEKPTPVSENSLFNYQVQMAKLKQQAQDSYSAWKQVGSETDQINFLNARTQLKALQAQFSEFNKEVSAGNKRIYSLGDSVEYFGAKFRSHLSWILTGGLIGGALAIPSQMIDSIKTLDEAMAGVKQVLPSIEHDQGAANKELQEFIGIAGQYGAAAEQVVDAGRSWGRMYKDVATVNLLVSQSTKMAVADNFSLAESVKGLESAMSQFGMKSEDINVITVNTNRILDVWTKVAHTGAASAQDLTAAVERAGASAHQAGVSFEFFNALVATGVRNTARSGAEIGQSLKSLFTSIHSDKAIEEIQKFGVELYKVNADGTKSFRDVQDVILDLSLAIQSTTKDTSKLELALGGGKWQVSKITAIMTDYKQILNMWEMAVNSAGFTNEQVKVQMDTLSRRIATMKAELDGLFTATGNKGFTQTLKDQTTSLTNFIRGLKETSGAIETLIHYTILGVAAYKGFDAIIKMVGFSKGAEYAATQLAAGVKREDIAVTEILTTSNNSLATAIMNRAKAEGVAAAIAGNVTKTGALAAAVMGNWVTIIGLVCYGLYELISAQGEASRKQDELTGKSQEQNDILLKQIEVNKQRTEFIDTLVDRYTKLSAEIDNNSGSTESNNVKIEQQKTILEVLARQLGVTTDELVKDGQLQVDKIDEIKKARDGETRQALQNNIDKMTAEYNATQQMIQNTQARIDAMKSEIKDVGVLGQAYQWLMGIIAQRQLDAAQEYRKLANNEINPDDYATDVGAAGQLKGVQFTDEQKSRYNEMADQAEAMGNATLAKAGQSGIGILQQQIADANGHAADLSGRIAKTAAQLSAIDSQSNKDDNDKEAPDPKAKKVKNPKGSNALEPHDNSQITADKLQYLDFKKREQGIDLALKQGADEYAISLDNISLKESMYGNTIDITNSKKLAAQDRINKLNSALKDQSQLENDIRWQLEQEMNRLKITDNVDWGSLGTKQQKEQLRNNNEVLQANQAVSQLYSMWVKVSEAVSSTTKEVTKLNNEQKKTDLAGIYDLDAMHNNIMSYLNENESQEVADNTNKLDITNESKLAGIKLDYAKARYDEYTEYIKEKENELKSWTGSKDSKEYQDKLLAIEKLKTAQKQLNQNIIQMEYDKNAKVKEGMEGVVASFVIQGNKLRDIWKNLWSSLAEDALKALFKIQNSSPGILSQVLGLFGGSSKGSSSNSKYSFSGISVTKPITGHAEGGIFDKEHVAEFAEGNKKEAVIPLEDNKDRGKQLWLQSGKELGMVGGHEVVPTLSNPDVAKGVSSVNVQLQQNQAHILELQRANQLMVQQNQMLAGIAQNGNNGGIVVMPVAPTADQVFSILESNPAALSNILGRQNNKGWR